MEVVCVNSELEIGSLYIDTCTCVCQDVSCTTNYLQFTIYTYNLYVHVQLQLLFSNTIKYIIPKKYVADEEPNLKKLLQYKFCNNKEIPSTEIAFICNLASNFSTEIHA